MILYHTTKTKQALESILLSRRLQPGRNVNGKFFVHLSTTFPGWVSMDVFGGSKSTQAWVLKVEVPDNTPLEPDPSGEDFIYDGKGTWFTHEGTLPIEILEVIYFSDYRDTGKKGVKIL